MILFHVIEGICHMQWLLKTWPETCQMGASKNTSHVVLGADSLHFDMTVQMLTSMFKVTRIVTFLNPLG